MDFDSIVRYNHICTSNLILKLFSYCSAGEAWHSTIALCLPISRRWRRRCCHRRCSLTLLIMMLMFLLLPVIAIPATHMDGTSSWANACLFLALRSRDWHAAGKLSPLAHAFAALCLPQWQTKLNAIWCVSCRPRRYWWKCVVIIICDNWWAESIFLVVFFHSF